MARPRKSADERLREQLAAAQNALQTKERVIAAQQTEIQDMRAMVAEIQAPKPGRPFRARKLIHGPLDITIKGTDVSEAEVVIEHMGGYLAIRVGDAIGAMQGTAAREVYRFTPAQEPMYQPALPMRPAESLQARELRSVGIADLSAVDVHGLNDGDPTVVNAALAPQADPRMPGAQQLPPETAVASRYGWTGTGPKPRGWKDTDAPKPDAAN